MKLNKTIKIDKQLGNLNIAESYKKQDLSLIGGHVKDAYDSDKTSRKDWEDRNESYIKLAAQVKETRSFPWAGSSNVKYPLLSIACLQFASRAYKQLFPSANIVKGKVVGYDPTGEKRKSAERISQHMSYQLMEEMEDWAEDMDRGLMILPICGNMFKKTYRDPGQNVSEVILPSDLVVNYYARSLEKASCKTHRLWFYPNEIETKFRSGEWIKPDNEFGDAPSQKDNESKSDVQGIAPPSDDSNAPHLFLEQHTFLDLDQDGYKEPVIVTIHNETQEVVRIVARYEAEDVRFGEDGNTIISIKPEEYFTNFIFFPDTTSGVYGQGFGSLLGPLNESSNSIINMLMDSGTLSNLPAGFLARGVRMKKGNTPFRPGEFRETNIPGDDIRKGIYTLPIKEPSTVMFNLLSMFLDAGQQLSSVSKLMAGESPGQNQPHSTTSDLLQQGMQVFESIYKRCHRSLKKEFRKLYKLNKVHVGEQEYFTVLDSTQNDAQGTVQKVDYLNEELDVVPASDPSVLGSAEKLQKAEALVGFAQMGTVNPQEATKRVLIAQGQDDIETLMKMPEPQPDPEIELKKEELAIKRMEVEGGQQLQAMKNQYQAMRDEAAAQATMSKAQVEQMRAQLEYMKTENAVIKDATAARLNEKREEVKLEISSEDNATKKAIAELEARVDLLIANNSKSKED